MFIEGEWMMGCIMWKEGVMDVVFGCMKVVRVLEMMGVVLMDRMADREFAIVTDRMAVREFGFGQFERMDEGVGDGDVAGDGEPGVKFVGEVIVGIVGWSMRL